MKPEFFFEGSDAKIRMMHACMDEEHKRIETAIGRNLSLVLRREKYITYFAPHHFRNRYSKQRIEVKQRLS